jgi:hypothetical protein
MKDALKSHGLRSTCRGVIRITAAPQHADPCMIFRGFPFPVSFAGRSVVTTGEGTSAFKRVMIPHSQGAAGAAHEISILLASCLREGGFSLFNNRPFVEHRARSEHFMSALHFSPRFASISRRISSAKLTPRRLASALTQAIAGSERNRPMRSLVCSGMDVSMTPPVRTVNIYPRRIL